MHLRLVNSVHIEAAVETVWDDLCLNGNFMCHNTVEALPDTSVVRCQAPDCGAPKPCKRCPGGVSDLDLAY